MSDAAITAVKSFAEAINAGDPERIAQLMTEDHTFIDSLSQGD